MKECDAEKKFREDRIAGIFATWFPLCFAIAGAFQCAFAR